MRFRDRREAGTQLAGTLGSVAERQPVVVGLGAGGLEVAGPVADALGAPLDVLGVRSVGAPANADMPIGAISEGGVAILDAGATRYQLLDDRDIDVLLATAWGQLDADLAPVRAQAAAHAIGGRTVVAVTDGMTTGLRCLAAARALRLRGPARVVLAAPVATPEAAARLRREGHEVVPFCTPDDVWSVGRWYDDGAPPSLARVACRLGLTPSPDIQG